MKSSITNCNSNDQLLQLVPIQLLQKAYFRQLMFEGANYLTIPSFAELGFLLLMSMYIMRYLLNDSSVSILHKLLPIIRAVQPMPEPVHDRVTTSSSGYCCRVLAEASCQPPTGCYFCSSIITGFRGKTLFSVCGLLTKGTRNCIEKSLYMTAWLKVNFDELSDML